jgi:Na+-translocating ferredoxin:NAD+ oxidoreductase RnfA subunit
MSAAVSLFFLAAFSLNLVTHIGIGVREIFNERDQGMRQYLFRAGAVFLSSLVLWHFFAYALLPLTLGFLHHFLLFPLCFLLAFAFEQAAQAAARRGGKAGARKPDSGEAARERFLQTISGALFVLAAVNLTLKLAINSAEAALLTAGFSGGLFFAALLLKAVRKRIAKEKVPLTMRGLPLMLVVMGLLAFVFSALAAALLGE